MIDLSNETIVALSAAPHHRMLRQGRRPGRPIHRSTLERWRTRGVSGVRLETAKLGGIRVTSEEAITRFLERVSDPDAAPDAPTPSQVGKAHRRAEAELDAAGI